MNALKKLFCSFGYAFTGLFFCIKTCRNFRIHTVAAVFTLYLSTFYNFSAEKYALLFITIGVVISLECVNTALEEICNGITKEYSLPIKKAKDAAAGAVLCSAIVSVAVAFKLFWDKDVFYKIYDYFSSLPRLFILIAAVLLAIVFIFYEDIFKNGKKQ